MIPFCRVLCFVLIAVALLSVDCRADSRTDSLQYSGKEAKTLFDDGLALFEVENYAAARDAFAASFQLNPKGAVLFNLAMCQKALFEYSAALDSFRQYLATYPDSPRNQQVATEIQELTRFVGTLRLSNVPDGAEVFLNGRSVGNTPLTSELVLDPESIEVKIVKPGFTSFETVVTVRSGKQLVVDVLMLKEQGRLSIDCGSVPAQLRIEGKEVGNCPYEGNFDPGSVTISAQAEGLPSYTKTIHLKSREAMYLVIDFKNVQNMGPALLPPDDVSLPSEDSQRGILQETAGTSDRGKSLRTAGWIVGGLGAASGVVGLVFSIKTTYDINKANEARDNWLDAPVGSEKEAKWESEYYKYADREPVDKTLMTTGYIAAGVLVTTGVVLIVVGSRKKESLSAPVAVKPSLGGLIVSFW